MENKLVAFITSTSFLDAKFDLSGYEFEHGTHNGYVAVPTQNKYHGKNLNDMEDIEVHGGITFSEPATYPEVMNGRKINEKYVGKKIQSWKKPSLSRRIQKSETIGGFSVLILRIVMTINMIGMRRR